MYALPAQAKTLRGATHECTPTERASAASERGGGAENDYRPEHIWKISLQIRVLSAPAPPSGSGAHHTCWKSLHLKTAAKRDVPPPPCATQAELHVTDGIRSHVPPFRIESAPLRMCFGFGWEKVPQAPHAPLPADFSVCTCTPSERSQSRYATRSPRARSRCMPYLDTIPRPERPVPQAPCKKSRTLTPKLSRASPPPKHPF